MTEIIEKTDDLGYTEIEIAKVGDYEGTLQGGDGTVLQHFTEDSLMNVVKKANDEGKEILLDQQHKSLQSYNTDDRACGWIKDLTYRAGSIFGKCFWTELGLKLIKSRIFRFISPVFCLDGEGQPTELVNVALTNSPAITDIRPVINSKLISEGKIMEIKEDIKPVEETVEVKQEPAEPAKEAVAEPVETEVKEAKPEDSLKEFLASDEFLEIVKNCVEKLTVKNEEPVKEAVKEEAADTQVKEEPEVIEVAALNSKPVTLKTTNGWENLSGKAFIDYINKGKFK